MRLLGLRYCVLAVASACVLAASCGDEPVAPPIVEFVVPSNPHLADSTWPIFHRDSYAQHASDLPAPTGAHPIDVRTVTRLTGIPIFVLFDSKGDVFTVVRGFSNSRVCKISHDTLALKSCVDVLSGNAFGGAYAYLDDADRLVVGTGTTISRYEDTDTGLVATTSIDVTTALAAGEALAAVTVRYSGELFFAGDLGTVGMMAGDLSAQPTSTLHFDGERVSNAITTDTEGGVYLVSSAYLRRVDAVGGVLVESWKEPIEASAETPRPGRLGTGSGTTPSLVMDDLITVADDADSMNVVVLRRGTDAALRGAPRPVCKVPVFDGPATTDNAIVVAGRTLILEQNLTGYGGVARFDIGEDGTCARTWVSDVSAPSCVPTLSKATGLVYVYGPADETGEWSLYGLDLATGKTRFRAPVGVGSLYNNLYAAVTIGPDGRVYLGTFSGLLVFSEATN